MLKLELPGKRKEDVSKDRKDLCWDIFSKTILFHLYMSFHCLSLLFFKYHFNKHLAVSWNLFFFHFFTSCLLAVTLQSRDHTSFESVYKMTVVPTTLYHSSSLIDNNLGLCQLLLLCIWVFQLHCNCCHIFCYCQSAAHHQNIMEAERENSLS